MRKSYESIPKKKLNVTKALNGSLFSMEIVTQYPTREILFVKLLTRIYTKLHAHSSQSSSIRFSQSSHCSDCYTCAVQTSSRRSDCKKCLVFRQSRFNMYFFFIMIYVFFIDCAMSWVDRPYVSQLR